MPKLSQPGREMAENSLRDLAPSLPVCEIAALSWVEFVGSEFVQCVASTRGETRPSGGSLLIRARLPGSCPQALWSQTVTQCCLQAVSCPSTGDRPVLGRKSPHRANRWRVRLSLRHGGNLGESLAFILPVCRRGW